MRYSTYVFDLDDTLIDTQVRHYKILQDYLSLKGVAFCSPEQYIAAREIEGCTNAAVAERFLPGCTDFASFWKTHVESEAYLQYDSELVNLRLLQELKAGSQARFILLSLRSNPDTARRQFETFRFAALFDEVFFLAHHTINPKPVVLQRLKSADPACCFVGDTLSDEAAAKKAGVDFYAVATGIHRMQFESSYKHINHFLLNQHVAI